MDRENKVKYQHVYIEWIDSETHADGWQDVTKHKPGSGLVRTAGFIIHEDKEFVSIALSVDEENEHYNAHIDIPKVCIKKRRKLNAGTKS